MTEQLQRNLRDAREHLCSVQKRLHDNRTRLNITDDSQLGQYEIGRLYRAIDRAWDAQCMAGGSL